MKRNRISAFTSIELAIVIAVGSVATSLGFVVQAQGRPSGLDQVSGTTATHRADQDGMSGTISEDELMAIVDLPYIPEERPILPHGASRAEMAVNSPTGLHSELNRARMAAAAISGIQIVWQPARINNPLYACLKIQATT